MKCLVKSFAGAVCITCGVLLWAAPTQALPVGVELSLAVDVSGSVSAREFELQMRGYELGFRNLKVQQTILGIEDGIAVDLVFWSSSDKQVEAVSFRHLNSLQEIENFADMLAAAERPFSGGTAIGAGITFAADALANNAFEGRRSVIDVSGDGIETTRDTEAGRDYALANGVDVINGLPIGSKDLETFYADHVIGGEGSFIIPAATFDDFRQAIQDKLVREIGFDPQDPPPTDVPEPSSLLLLTAALGGLQRKMRSKK